MTILTIDLLNELKVKAPIKRAPSSLLGMAEREEARQKVKAPIKRAPSSLFGMAEREEARQKVKAPIKRAPSSLFGMAEREEARPKANYNYYGNHWNHSYYHPRPVGFQPPGLGLEDWRMDI